MVHEAIREALVNAVIHAYYRGQGGSWSRSTGTGWHSRIPALAVSLEQVWSGESASAGTSRFRYVPQIGGGEKAGSGIDKIRQGWAAQHWRLPIFGRGPARSGEGRAADGQRSSRRLA